MYGASPGTGRLFMSRRGSTAELPRPSVPPARDGGLGVMGASRRRPTWALLGAALVVVAMLAGAWVFASNARSTAVLVASHDLAAGTVVEANDFRVVEVSQASGLRALTPSQLGLIQGRAARGPIPQGTLVNVDLFAARDVVVPAGLVVVGVALDPGASPSSRLAAGDRVEVLAVTRPTTGGATGLPPAAAVVLTVGSVWSVEPIGSGSGSGKAWVSLLIPQGVHAEVAQAAADGRVRLGLLGVTG